MAEHLSDQHIEDLREAFNLFDRTQDGTINSKDLLAVLKALGQNPSEEEARVLINQYDKEGTGTIDFPEFLTMVARRQKELLKDENELKDALVFLDKDDDGFIEKDEFEEVARSMNEVLSETELENMLGSIPYDSVGKIEVNQFVRFIFGIRKTSH